MVQLLEGHGEGGLIEQPRLTELHPVTDLQEDKKPAHYQARLVRIQQNVIIQRPSQDGVRSVTTAGFRHGYMPSYKGLQHSPTKSRHLHCMCI